MSIIERIQNAGLIVKGILALMVLLPSLTVFLKLVDIPPTVGGVIYIIGTCVSIAVILSIILLTDVIERMSNTKLVICSGLALAMGSFCLTQYAPFAFSHLVPFVREDGNAAKVLAPMSPSEDILKHVPHRTPGRPTVSEYTDALQMAAESDELERLMARASWRTMVVMLLLLVCSEVLLIAPIVALAWKLAGGTISPPADNGAKAATAESESTAEDVRQN